MFLGLGGSIPKNLYCYNVITQPVSEVFEAKLRRIGNSVGIIIPNEVLSAAGYDVGDTVPVTIPKHDFTERNRKLRSIIGIHKGLPGFERDKEDRY
jgi:hypothetical protein